MSYKVKQPNIDINSISPGIREKIDTGSKLLFHSQFVQQGSRPLSLQEICITDDSVIVSEQISTGPFQDFKNPTDFFVDKIKLTEIVGINIKHNFRPGNMAILAMGCAIFAITIFSIVIFFGNMNFSLEFDAFYYLLISIPAILLLYMGRNIEIILSVKNRTNPVSIYIYGFRRNVTYKNILKHLQLSEAGPRTIF